jgi:hypothetical protein
LPFAILIDHRQRDSGQFRLLVVDESVRSEMDNPISRKVGSHDCRARGLEPECSHSSTFRRKGEDGICFLSTSRQSRKLETVSEGLAAPECLNQISLWRRFGIEGPKDWIGKDRESTVSGVP